MKRKWQLLVDSMECGPELVRKMQKRFQKNSSGIIVAIASILHSSRVPWGTMKFCEDGLQERMKGLKYWGGPCSGCWFLVRFSDLILGCQDNGFIQERGVVAGTRVGVVILVPVFLGALVAVFLVVLVFFRTLSWLQFRAWTGVGFLRGRLVVFFVAVLVGPFVAVLVVVLLFAFV